MSMTMHAEVTTRTGGAELTLETEQVVKLIGEILAAGCENRHVEDFRIDYNDNSHTRIRLRDSAAQRLLDLLDGNPDDLWAAVEDALVQMPEEEIAPDDEDLARLVGNLIASAPAWRAAIDDGWLVLALETF